MVIYGRCLVILLGKKGSVMMSKAHRKDELELMGAVRHMNLSCWKSCSTERNASHKGFRHIHKLKLRENTLHACCISFLHASESRLFCG